MSIESENWRTLRIMEKDNKDVKHFSSSEIKKAQTFFSNVIQIGAHGIHC